MVDVDTVSGEGEGKEESQGLEMAICDLSFQEKIETFEHQAEIKRWLEWCRKHSKVICVEYEVPNGILPKGYTGVLIDVKVGGKKRAPDDKIYMENADLRAKVARGNCVLELNRIEKGRIAETKYIFLIFALRKFSGGLGDEDDSNYAQSQWFNYFVKGIETTKKVVSTEKENGEAAHVSVRKFLGHPYFCIGSKNVHMLVRNEDDILKYKDSRFGFARSIAHTFFRTVIANPEISELKKAELVEFMDRNRFTAVGEILQPDHQHVVNLSHLKHPELRFICWTIADLSNDFKTDTLCALPIHEAIEKAREFGFKTTNYEVIEFDKDPTSEAEQIMLKIRRGAGYEGKVLYFIDDENCTIGLIKKKTAWYILLRAIREKVAAFASSLSSRPMSDKLKMLSKRVNEIKTWLNFSDQYAAGWIELASGFAMWLNSNKSVKSNIRENFPVIFNEYLVQNPVQKALYNQLLNDFEEHIAV